MFANVHTWVFISNGGVYKEPVVQRDELKESETGPGQIAKPVRVHLTVQPSTNDGKYVYEQLSKCTMEGLRARVI